MAQVVDLSDEVEVACHPFREHEVHGHRTRLRVRVALPHRGSIGFPGEETESSLDDPARSAELAFALRGPRGSGS